MRRTPFWLLIVRFVAAVRLYFFSFLSLPPNTEKCT